MFNYRAALWGVAPARVRAMTNSVAFPAEFARPARQLLRLARQLHSPRLATGLAPFARLLRCAYPLGLLPC